MRKLLGMVCVGWLASLGTAASQEDAVKKERAKMQGIWQVVSSEEDAQATPDFIVQNLKIVIKDDQISLKGVEDLLKKFGKITMVVDPATTPKIIDFKIDAGSEKGMTYEGIYELKDDTLKICASTRSGNRPDEFKTSAGSNRVLFVLKRDKN
jgi:uncharacterized protein (TIGR03067 family)